MTPIVDDSPSSAQDESVVITGVGVVSPLGLSAGELTRRFCSGESAVRPLAGLGFAGALGAQVEEIPLDALAGEARARAGRLDRVSRLFLSAAHLAVTSANLVIDDSNAERCGLSFGTGFGCLLTNAEYNQKVNDQGLAAASPRLFAATVSSAAAGEVSIALGIKGPNVTAHMGFAAGLGAVGYGFDLIRTGKADVVLAGGADALGAALVHGLADMGLVKSERAVPFRDAQPGVYSSEGAMVAVLESSAHAQRRGARAWVRVEGYAAGFEPTLTRRNREATGITATLRRALVASGRAAGEIDLIMTSAHATPLDDTERAALGGVFGTVRPPLLLAPKMAWGESFAAAPVLALALATALVGPEAPALADGLAFQLTATGVRPARAEGAPRARLAMVHGLCYSGASVALVVARQE